MLQASSEESRTNRANYWRRLRFRNLSASDKERGRRLSCSFQEPSREAGAIRTESSARKGLEADTKDKTFVLMTQASWWLGTKKATAGGRLRRVGRASLLLRVLLLRHAQTIVSVSLASHANHL